MKTFTKKKKNLKDTSCAKNDRKDLNWTGKPCGKVWNTHLLAWNSLILQYQEIDYWTWLCPHYLFFEKRLLLLTSFSWNLIFNFKQFLGTFKDYFSKHIYRKSNSCADFVTKFERLKSLTFTYFMTILSFTSQVFLRLVRCQHPK